MHYPTQMRIRSAPQVLKKFRGSPQSFGLQMFPCVWLRAKRDIEVGEEIRISYGTAANAAQINAVPHSTHPPLHTIG